MGDSTTQGDGVAPEVNAGAALAAELETTRRTLESIRRERDVQKVLFEAGVHDLDIGVVMIEREAQGAPEKPVAELVAELKRRKPGLFVRAATPAGAAPRVGGSTMGARPASDDPRRVAAERAAATGDRSSLMAYLRLRRQTA